MIWKTEATIEGLNAMSENTMGSHLGMEFTGIGDDFLEARMPVDHRTKQPMGLLHGGASAALAETLGSVASYLCIEDISKETAVGLNITADHLRPISKGWVTGIARPIKLGRKIHLWSIEIKNEKDQLVCISKLSVMIIPKP
ncbi:MAG: hotdog fold thioesterase [Saprospiraceae bacterium]|nr:MAG: phenylacetic acid degradation-like protein [Candidatus Parvibacillus calidus]MBK7739271.1 hotdog fold thioesterase [Candidatus Parvibacillus calidus]MCC7149336.1 hotdog fold thioesterase [Saprospiraceae bacterium]WKZ63139.1 MAG: hotdog fold thioesterase [Saprospiraceae bacterium]